VIGFWRRSFEGLSRAATSRAGFLVLSSLWLFVPYFILNSGQHRLLVRGMAVLFVLLAVLLGMASRGIYVLFGLAILLLNAVYVHLKYHWGLELSESRFEAAFSGEFSETLEYCRIYFGSPEIVFFLYGIAALYLIYRTCRSPGFSRRARIVAGLLLLPLLALLFFVRGPAMHFPPVFLVKDVFEAKSRLGQIAERAAIVRAVQSQPRACPEGYEKIVIVIGESALRDRMSLYGYPLETTPFLDSLRPYRFDGLAGANQTRYAVPLLLTHASVGDFQEFFSTPSLVSELKACGYETWWISNQGGPGIGETYVESIADEADHQRFMSSLDYVRIGYDGKIVDTLGRYLTGDTRKQAFFLHLRGSHFDYQERYPSDFALKPGVDVVSQYDNTIYYTDHILSEIFGRLDSATVNMSDGRGLLFAYASDHGEVVSDTLHGHGFFPGFKEEYRIPMIFWTRRPRGDSLQAGAEGRTVNEESFAGMIEYLTGMKDHPDLSFSSEVISLAPENIQDYNRLKSAFSQP